MSAERELVAAVGLEVKAIAVELERRRHIENLEQRRRPANFENSGDGEITLSEQERAVSTGLIRGIAISTTGIPLIRFRTR